MDKKLFNVTLTCQFSDKRKAENIIKRLSVILNIEPEKVKKRIALQQPWIIKKNATLKTANALKDKFEKIGVICILEPVADEINQETSRQSESASSEDSEKEAAPEHAENQNDAKIYHQRKFNNLNLRKWFQIRDIKEKVGGKYFFITFAADLFFLLSLILPSIYLVSIFGIFFIVRNIFLLRKSVLLEKVDMPLLWFLPVTVFPITTFFALKNGLWKEENISAYNYYKFGLTCLTLFLAFIFFSSAMDSYLEKRFLIGIENHAEQYLDKSFKEAGASFLLARTANAVISVMQSVSFSAGAIVSGDVSPGEFLDPVNDIIERFSMVMLISSVSLGIQKILMEIGCWIGFSVFLPLGLCLVAISVWLSEEESSLLKKIGCKIIIISIVIRIGIPAVAYIGSTVDSYILDEMYEKSQQELNDFYNETSIDIGIKDIKNIKDKIEILKERTKRTINHFVTLIVVFTLRTIFIPILTLWGLLTILGYIIKNNDSGRIVKSIKLDQSAERKKRLALSSS